MVEGLGKNMLDKNYKIQKDTVQETLIIPLYARKLAMDMYPDLFNDKECQMLFDQIDYRFKASAKSKQRIGALMAATRQYNMASVCREYLNDHPNACVVNIGCGLDTTFRQIDNGTAKGYNIDFPDVIDVRNELLPVQKRETNIASDLMDFTWFDQIEYSEKEGIVFFASGVFYYLKKENVKKLLSAMANYFKGGRIAFDATNASGLKKLVKTWIDPSVMKNIGAYFSVDGITEFHDWSDNFAQVIQKGYMTGYRPLDSRYGIIANCIFKFVDQTQRCQMIEITFKSSSEGV